MYFRGKKYLEVIIIECIHMYSKRDLKIDENFYNTKIKIKIKFYLFSSFFLFVHKNLN